MQPSLLFRARGVIILLALVLQSAALTASAWAANTNVFPVSGSLRVAGLEASEVQLAKAKNDLSFLIPAGAPQGDIVLVVPDFDCAAQRVRPNIRLAIYNPAAMSNKLFPLIEFVTEAAAQASTKKVVLQTRGVGLNGVSADLSALITYEYVKCTPDLTPTAPVRVTIEPLGSSGTNAQSAIVILGGKLKTSGNPNIVTP